MSKVSYINRVNLAGNFWADTVGVDYCESLTWEEVLEQDRENLAVRFLFKQELAACGY